MSKNPLTLQINTTEYGAAQLLELLVEKFKGLPTGMPERQRWVELATQVADNMAGVTRPGAGYGRGV